MAEKGYTQSKTVQGIAAYAVLEVLLQLGVVTPEQLGGSLEALQTLATAWGAIGVRDVLKNDLGGLYKAG